MRAAATLGLHQADVLRFNLTQLNALLDASRRPARYCQQFIDSKTAGLVKMHLPQGMNLIALE